MKILFGHPGGNPNSHQAAQAHFEAGRLEAFCVPWMPSAGTLRMLSAIPLLRAKADRLARRRFEPLACAPKVQGRFGELRRLFIRARGRGDEGLAYEANDWLMRTMKRECHRKSVTAVHSYEDCSQWQFEEAKRQGKACIYDMPIGYYPWWEQQQAELAQKFTEWLPPGGLPSNRWARPQQKRREMELADLVLAPSTFVKETILQFHPDKKIALAPYGVDLEFWKPPSNSELRTPNSELRFIYAGQCSIRKGTPLLLEAWAKAGLNDTQLELVGSWQLALERQKNLPRNVTLTGPLARKKLRQKLCEADVFVFPTYFEGRSLAIGEALACGLPVVTTNASGMTDLVDETCGRIIPSGDLTELVESLFWFVANRDKIRRLGTAARAKVETCTWENYRKCVCEAVSHI